MTKRYVDYRVKQYDTLETIALRFLGDADAWRDLAALNKLRSPFISDDPKHQFGVSRYDGTLPSVIPIGATSVVLPGIGAGIARENAVLYLETYDGLGKIFYESIIVASYDRTTGILAFDQEHNNGLGAQYLWPYGHHFDIFDPTDLIDSYVLKTGDVLHIPSDNGVAIPATGRIEDGFIDLLGVDIEVTDSGLFSLSANGDLATVSGYDNLRQAVRDRIGTPIGELVYHPDYGNAVFNYIGTANTPVFRLVAQAFTQQAAHSDPRVSSVPVFSAIIDGDVLLMNIGVISKESSELIKNIPAGIVLGR